MEDYYEWRWARIRKRTQIRKRIQLPSLAEGYYERKRKRTRTPLPALTKGESKMITKIQECIKHNLPLLIFGKSGWGKTAMVEQAGEALNMEVVKLSLALSLPEDIGGIPAPKGESFQYRLPQWFHSRKNKAFVLFLDEINQASVQVLHAIYSLVHERRLHHVTNPEMRIVAAGNMEDENPHLTEIMTPLLKRFYVEEFVHNEQDALAWLNAKYGLNLKELGTGAPRDTEQAIVAYRAGLRSLAIKKGGLTLVNYLDGAGSSSNADELIKNAKTKKIRDRNGFI